MPLSVRHSILDADAVGTFVENHYQVGEVQSAELYRSWVNEVYRIRLGDGTRVYFKLARKSWRTVEDVRQEAELQESLYAQGVPVARPLTSCSGESVVRVDAPEGTRAGVLYRGLPGRKPVLPHAVELYKAFGSAAARLHIAMDHIATPPLMGSRDDGASVLRHALVIQQALETDKDREILDWLAVQLCERVATVEPSLDQGLIHGDLTLDNLTVDEHGTITFFDFDLACVGFRASEIVGLYSWARNEPSASPFLEAFLEVYRCLGPFSEADEASLPLLALVHELWDLAHEIRNWRSWSGHWRMPIHEITARIERLRDWHAELA